MPFKILMFSKSLCKDRLPNPDMISLIYNDFLWKTGAVARLFFLVTHEDDFTCVETRGDATIHRSTMGIADRA